MTVRCYAPIVGIANGVAGARAIDAKGVDAESPEGPPYNFPRKAWDGTAFGSPVRPAHDIAAGLRLSA